MDGESREIDAFNPYDHQIGGEIREIEPNEEIIGVYGVRSYSILTGFGFIVKVATYQR